MKQFVGSVIGGIIGGAIIMLALNFQSARAAGDPEVIRAGSVAARSFDLFDKQGHLRAQLATSIEGGPALFIMDSKGKARVVIGVYPQAEGEEPFVVLNDPQQNAAGLFRLVGEKHLPYVILKNSGQDRSIYGLSANPNDGAFLMNKKSSGQEMVFGKQ